MASQVLAIEGDAPLEVPAVPFLFEGKKGLILPKKELHLGSLRRGVSAQGELDLHNTAASKIAIKEIKANCDCLQFALPGASTYEPDGHGKLAITLNTENIPFGDFIGTGYLTTDEKLLPTTLVTVTARIAEELLVYPSTLSFWGKDDLQQQRLIIVQPFQPNDAFKITSIEADAKLWQTAISVGEHGRHEIVITQKALPDRLPAIEVLTLYTQGVTAKKIPLFIHINSTQGLRIMPFAADLGELAEGAHITKKFSVSGIPPHHSISIYPKLGCAGEYIEHPAGILQLRGPKTSGGQSEVEFELVHNGHFHGNIHGKIVVVPDDPTLAETSFEFRALFAGKKVGS